MNDMSDMQLYAIAMIISVAAVCFIMFCGDPKGREMDEKLKRRVDEADK